MNIKRNIIFALESRKKASIPIVDNVPIRMRVNFASQRIEFTTGIALMQPSGMPTNSESEMAAPTNSSSRQPKSMLRSSDTIPRYKRYSRNLRWTK